jgi:hypothetical protein
MVQHDAEANLAEGRDVLPRCEVKDPTLRRPSKGLW